MQYERRKVGLRPDSSYNRQFSVPVSDRLLNKALDEAIQARSDSLGKVGISIRVIDIKEVEDLIDNENDENNDWSEDND